jgi:hypothetical protein
MSKCRIGILHLLGDAMLKEEKNSNPIRDKVSNGTKLRLLVRRLNNIRRIQKQKIDILCNDIIKAHGTFINHLKGFRFAADFYERLLGAASLDALAASAGEFLIENIADCGIAIIFITSDGPQIHFYSKDPLLEDIPSHITPNLTAKMVEAVCQSSKVCFADDLCKMGFFAGPAVLKRISLGAIGLNNTGPALGMILVYRCADKQLYDSELSLISSIVAGLAKAVKAMQNANRCDSIA